jgi:phage/plasmid-like protein (TIGR03299 family)
MSHEITTRANDFAEMAFVGETPWHGLGQQLQQGASIEEWTQAAGMDWRVKRSKVRYFANAEGTDQREWDDNHVLLRSDTGKPLGLVSDSYKVVQPKTILEFFRDLTENAGYHLHTAGTLFGGRKFWALAKVAESVVTGNDRVGGYLLLSTACDGSMATECRETAIRVVCNNTLSMARTNDHRGVIKVSHRSVFNADRVKAQMQDSAEHFATFIASARELSAKRVTNAMAEQFVRQLLRPSEVIDLTGEDDSKRAPKGEAEILNLFRSSAIGGTLLGTAGTAWGLVNAVTEYVDHRQSAKTDSHRLDRAFFGSGDDLKTRAFDLAFNV